MRTALLALVAARLAIASPLARPDGGPGGHGGGHGGMGGGDGSMAGMDMGAGMESAAANPVNAIPSPVAFPDPAIIQGPVVTQEKFQFNNLQAPMYDRSQLYMERALDPAKAYYADSQVKTVKYGPYNVPAMGMLDGKWAWNIEKPCTDCYITALQADLTDDVGQSINIADGAWLHHIVIYNGMGFTPFSEQDLVCSGTLLSAYMGWPHRIFASGNERIPIRLNTRYKYGLEVGYIDNFHLLYDLVNLANKPRDFYITMTYEFVPRSNTEYKRARMLWMDITGCGTSEAPPVEGFYELKGPGWNSTIEGALLATIGHTHDGGAWTTLYINGKPVCRSDQLYGTKRAYFEKPMVPNLNTEAVVMGGDHSGGMSMSTADDNMPMDMEGMEYADPMTTTPSELQHISSVSSCVNFGILKKGDFITIGATYNTTMHNMNRNMEPGHTDFLTKIFPGANDKYAGIMGISPVYVAEGLMSLP